MTKRIFSIFMALIMVMLTPMMVCASEEETIIDYILEEEASFDANVTAIPLEEEVTGAMTGFRNFEDSYNGITLTGVDGKTTVTTSEGSKQLTDSLVAVNGFIQRAEPNTIYMIFANGSVYWYNTKYQGLTGNIQKMGIKVSSSDYDGNSTSFTTADGTVNLLTESEVKDKLGKKDNSSSSKDDSSSSSKDDSSSSKDDSSSSSKDHSSSSSNVGSDGSTNINVKDVIPAFSFVDVVATVNGQEVTYRLNTGDYGEIQEAGRTADGIVYILFKNGKLVFWHPSMLNDLSKTTVEAKDMYLAVENAKETRTDNGTIGFYDSSGNKITIPTILQLKNPNINYLNFSDYVVDNSVTNGKGYKTWILLTKASNRYYVVKNAETDIELKFDYVGKNKIMFNGKKYKAYKASWSSGGDLFLYRGKKKGVYVIRLARKKDGTYKNKMLRFAKRARQLHIDPNTNLADYVILKNGEKVSCVTGKKIN